MTERKNGLTYADSGVDIDAGNRLVDLIKPMVRATARAGADAEIGGFGGLFDLKAAGFKDAVLVAATDGVGKAWVSSLSPAGSQGSAQGLFQGLSGIGVLMAGIWGGLTWGSSGEVPLVVAGSAAGLLAVLVAVGLEGR